MAIAAIVLLAGLLGAFLGSKPHSPSPICESAPEAFQKGRIPKPPYFLKPGPNGAQLLCR